MALAELLVLENSYKHMLSDGALPCHTARSFAVMQRLK